MLSQAKQPHQQSAGEARSCSCEKHHNPHFECHRRRIGRGGCHIRLGAFDLSSQTLTWELLSG